MIQRVAILGAGAVGGYFVWGLSEKLGKNLWVIAKGERKERLEREGLTIKGEIFHFPGENAGGGSRSGFAFSGDKVWRFGGKS